MSAMTGIWLCLAISGSASASSWEGQATRTMSQPVAVSSAICWSVALTSVVGVVHIDCTEMGASPPTSTLPTLILRDRRRGATTGGGRGGIPSETVMRPVSPTCWTPSWSPCPRYAERQTLQLPDEAIVPSYWVSESAGARAHAVERICR